MIAQNLGFCCQAGGGWRGYDLTEYWMKGRDRTLFRSKEGWLGWKRSTVWQFSPSFFLLGLVWQRERLTLCWKITLSNWSFLIWTRSCQLLSPYGDEVLCITKQSKSRSKTFPESSPRLDILAYGRNVALPPPLLKKLERYSFARLTGISQRCCLRCGSRRTELQDLLVRPTPNE